MEKIREMLRSRDKKSVTNLITFFAIGVVLLIAGSTLFIPHNDDSGGGSVPPSTANSSASEDESVVNTDEANSINSTDSIDSTNGTDFTDISSYEKTLESELENILSQIDGTGKVDVMLTLASSSSIDVAENSDKSESTVQETDSQGGSREETSSSDNDEKIMYNDKDNVQKPLILSHEAPEIEGVVIVAEGGDDVNVQAALINATSTVLGIEPYKVKVYKMEMEEN